MELLESDLAARMFPVLEGRVASARASHSQFLEDKGADARLVQALNCLRLRAKDVERQMAAMQLGAQCSVCAARPGGGCCGEYMAGETDELQLLINLLAGVEIGVVFQSADSCPFLASEGCRFLFKPMFCLNYLCHAIRSGADPAQVLELERLTGLQLQQQYTVEQLLQDWQRGKRRFANR